VEEAVAVITLVAEPVVKLRGSRTADDVVRGAEDVGRAVGETEDDDAGDEVEAESGSELEADGLLSVPGAVDPWP